MEQIEFSIPKMPTFDVEQTLDCGQVFRFVKDGNAFKVCAKNHMARIEDKGCEYSVVCDDKDFLKSISISTPITPQSNKQFKTADSCLKQSNTAREYIFCAKTQ